MLASVDPDDLLNADASPELREELRPSASVAVQLIGLPVTEATAIVSANGFTACVHPEGESIIEAAIGIVGRIHLISVGGLVTNVRVG